MKAKNLLVRVARNESVKHRRLAIVNRDGVTVALNIQRQVLAHHAETNHSNVCSGHKNPENESSCRGFMRINANQKSSKPISWFCIPDFMLLLLYSCFCQIRA